MHTTERTNPFTFFLGAIVFLTAAIFIILKVSFQDFNNLYAYLCAVNASMFALIGYDKGIAGSRTLRIPERIFYAGALLGGWLGVFLGTKKFRHKVRKAKFKFHIALIVLVQVCVIWLLKVCELVTFKFGGG